MWTETGGLDERSVDRGTTYTKGQAKQKERPKITLEINVWEKKKIDRKKNEEAKKEEQRNRKVDTLLTKRTP